MTQLAKEAFVVALEDILREHTLAYIGYPEKATMKDKVLRVLLSTIVLPIRIGTSFRENVFRWLSKIIHKINPPKKDETDSETDSLDSTDTTSQDSTT